MDRPGCLGILVVGDVPATMNTADQGLYLGDLVYSSMEPPSPAGINFINGIDWSFDSGGRSGVSASRNLGDTGITIELTPEFDALAGPAIVRVYGGSWLVYSGLLFDEEDHLHRSIRIPETLQSRECE